MILKRKTIAHFAGKHFTILEKERKLIIDLYKLEKPNLCEIKKDRNEDDYGKRIIKTKRGKGRIYLEFKRYVCFR